MKNTNEILKKLSSKTGQIALLLDPEKCTNLLVLKEILQKSEFSKIDYLFIGGSTVTKNEFDKTIDFIKLNSNLPLIIFPGASHQISEKADAILYLSLLSGRNPDFLIGHHVQTALEVYEMDIEVLPTAYILIDGGTKSSVAYVSQTIPIPRDQNTIIKNTATAGVLQGKKIIYFDAGSGAEFSVNPKIVEEVQFLDTPIIVGGGIRTIEQIEKLKSKGVNVIVIGNHIEENIDFLLDIHSYNLTKN